MAHRRLWAAILFASLWACLALAPGIAVHAASAPAGHAFGVPDLGQMNGSYKATSRGAMVRCSTFTQALQEMVKGGVEGVCADANYSLSENSPFALKLPIRMSEVGVNLATLSEARASYRASLRLILSVLRSATSGQRPVRLGAANLPPGVRAVAYRATTRKAVPVSITGVTVRVGTVVAVLFVVGLSTPAEQRTESELWPSWAAFFKTGQ